MPRSPLVTWPDDGADSVRTRACWTALAVVGSVTATLLLGPHPAGPTPGSPQDGTGAQVSLQHALDPGAAPPTRPRTGPARPPTGTGYTVLRRQGSTGAPVTYDACRPVRVVVNLDGAPPDGLAIVRSAVATAAAASGLHLVVDGTSREVAAPGQDRRRLDSDVPPVLVGWTRVPLDPRDPTVIGAAGSQTRTDRSGTQFWEAGQVALDSGWFARMSAGHRTDVEEAVVLHELGHVLGLGHVPDPHEVMNPDSAATATTLGPGDRRGFWVVGHGPCAAD